MVVFIQRSNMWELKVHAQKIKLLSEFLPDFYILSLKLTAFAPGIITQFCETLYIVVFIKRSNMWGVEVHMRKIELLCKFSFDFHVLGL